jgi:glycosyltransferase involved in cell wall biosynthesis
MGSPAVSVIMNCYNGERWLRTAIDSVFAQTYRDWEIVFWDNASTDGSAAIAQSYGPRVRYFRAAQTSTLGAARTLAAREARCRYIAILDCDDVWLPDKLERQVARMDARPELALVYSDCWFIDGVGEILGRAFERTRPPTGDSFLGLLTRPNFIPCLTILMRRDVLEKIGWFHPELRYTEEYDLVLRVARDHPIDFFEEPLAQYRLHGANTTGTGSPGTTREMLAVMERTVRDLPALGVRDRWAIRTRMGLLRCKLLVQYLKAASLWPR